MPGPEQAAVVVVGAQRAELQCQNFKLFVGMFCLFSTPLQAGQAGREG